MIGANINGRYANLQGIGDFKEGTCQGRLHVWKSLHEKHRFDLGSGTG